MILFILHPSSFIPSTMYFQRLLQITMAALAVLGTLLLSMGQRDLVLPLAMILAAGASVWLTDIKGLLRLNRTFSNIAMILVALVSLRELITLGGEIQAIGFARLLIYLQIIVLFQKKDARSYWLLFMLSLLQVVVATLFSQGIFFGFMLIIYLLIASLGLTLLMFQRQYEKFAPEELSNTMPVADRSSPSDQQTEFSYIHAGDIQAGLGQDLYYRLLGLGLRTLGVTALLFIFLPRFGQVAWLGSIVQSRQTVGFNNQVNLGEFGEIIENPDEVMRIRFYEHVPGKPHRMSETPIKVHGGVYLRGGVLMNYNRGQWRAGQAAAPFSNATLARLPKDKKLPNGIVYQECMIEGLDRRELFYVAPYAVVKDYLYIILDEAQLRLLRSEHLRNTRYAYTLGTTAIVNGVQLPLVPRKQPEDRWYATLRDPSKNLPNLARLAKEWIDESNLPAEDSYGRAKYLEKKLAKSGLFRYSLEGQNRDLKIDPIEDFVTKNRAGHCEYFATTLTLMLRSQKIPARMVVGFMTDEWNQVGQCYQVRQLHAHSWVECWLSPSQLPRELMHGENYWDWSEYGGWLQLDPTPESEAASQTSWYDPVTKSMQWFDSVWSYYVVELNYERQRNAIFRPIVSAFNFIYTFLTDPQTWHNLFDPIVKALRLSGWPGLIAWGLLILLILALAAFVALLFRLIWLLVDKLWRKISGRPPKSRLGPRIEVEFYQRLETLLAKQGLVRATGQTQREFTNFAGVSLADKSSDNSIMPLLERVADAFYRVRFGRLPLDKTQSEAVEQALVQIKNILKISSAEI